MSTTQLQQRAFREWSRSDELKCRFHTFDYYWWEQYARVYRLPVRARAIGRPEH